MATAAPTTEMGNVASWDALASGFDDGEPEPALMWPKSVAVYDRMRRYSQIRAVLWALTLPLRRPIWALDGEGCRPELVAKLSEDIDLPILGGDQVRRSRLRGRFSWSEHLRLALLSLPFGHMPFEITGDVIDGMWRLHKLSPRFPQSLTDIKVARDGGLVYIEQADPESKPHGYVRIPVERLVFYVIDREGGSWAGTSVLRAAYGDWLLHDRLMRVNAQAIERNGMGVPFNEPIPDASPTDAQEKAAQAMASAWRSGEYAGATGVPGYHFRLVGVEGTLPDALPTLSYHDAKIAKSVQAQFMELGTSGNTGNRALGGVFVDNFARAVDGIATQLADTTTKHVVEDWVDWNYGGSEPAPRIVAQPVDAETDLPLESIGELVRLGAITMDDDLESYLRNRGRMPAKRDGAVITPASAEAAGSLIRAGFKPEAALSALGLPAIEHTGRLPVTVQGAGGAGPVAAGRRVAASAPGAEPYADKLAEFYAPKIADAIAGSVDVDAIVSAFGDE